MAKKKVTTVEELDTPEVPVIPEPPEDTDPLESMFDDLRGATGMKLNVYRLGEGAGYRNRAMEFCFMEDNPEKMELGMIQERLQNEPWNGGEFRLVVRDAKQIVDRQDIRVARVTSTKPQVQNTNEIVAQITAGFAPIMQQMMSMVQKASERPDPMASFMQNMELMKQMKAVFAPEGSAPATERKSLTDSVKEILEFRTSMEALGLSDREPSTLQALQPLIGKGLEAFAAIMAARGAAPAVQPAPQVAQHIPQIVQNPTPPKIATVPESPRVMGDVHFTAHNQVETKAMPDVIGILTQFAGKLPAKDAAANFLNVLPEDKYEQVCDMIDAFEINAFIAAHPALEPHRVWVMELVNELDAMTAEGSPDEGGTQ